MGSNNITKGGSTKETILFNAYTLFTNQGYHDISMRQIAEAAEIALGGIYNHFESKEEIVTTVLIDFHPAHQVIPVVMREAGGVYQGLRSKRRADNYE